MDLNEITGVVVCALMFMVGRGYWPIITFLGREWGDYMVRGALLVLTAVVLRIIYWDLARLVIEDWSAFAATMGGVAVNGIFNALVAVACYQFMKGRLLLIPEDDRDGWYWWNAWAYPPKKCFINWRARSRRK